MAENEVRYFFQFREQDGDWSEWFECSRDDYLRKQEDPFYNTVETP